MSGRKKNRATAQFGHVSDGTTHALNPLETASTQVANEASDSGVHCGEVIKFSIEFRTTSAT